MTPPGEPIVTPTPGQRRRFVLLVALLAAVLVVYLNHFQNSFHFDDAHSVVDNPYIRRLGNIPRFWTDATTFSVLPTNRTYRPVVSTTLALDYWLGGGLKPFCFHLSTFIAFLGQLTLMLLLFERIGDRARPGTSAFKVALFATALFGLHPAIAETVNYVIQRGDLLSTLGVVAALWLYAASPRARRYHLYLVPATLAQLTKPPALVFPALLLAYLVICEEMPWRTALRRSLPALLAAVAAGAFQAAMTPPTFAAGAGSAYAFRLSQPLVSLHHFRNFFLPFWLSADTDHEPLTTLWSGPAWRGIGFVAAVLVTIGATLRRRATRPVAFGLAWYLIAQAPTVLYAVAEVENDHRMFFPFVGLTLAVTWAVRLALGSPWPRRATLPALLVLAALAAGTWERNRVWRTEATLWRDVTQKSPRNGRGLMNYGLCLLAKGDPAAALDYFNRAAVFVPNYTTLQINLGIAHGALGHAAEAEQHFRRALELAPRDGAPHFFYGRWLQQQRRIQEALAEARAAVALNPALIDARHLLLTLLWQQRLLPELHAVIRDTLALLPDDAVALDYRQRAAHPEAVTSTDPAPVVPTAENFLDGSNLSFRAGQFEASLNAARAALRLRPDYAEAHNNLAAAYAALARWDEAAAAAREALRLRPDFPLARNNLAWAEAHRHRSLPSAAEAVAPRR
jgi:tetratricopeptide (TPR) repeat protein